MSSNPFFPPIDVSRPVRQDKTPRVIEDVHYQDLLTVNEQWPLWRIEGYAIGCTHNVSRVGSDKSLETSFPIPPLPKAQRIQKLARVAKARPDVASDEIFYIEAEAELVASQQLAQALNEPEVILVPTEIQMVPIPPTVNKRRKTRDARVHGAGPRPRKQSTAARQDGVHETFKSPAEMPALLLDDIDSATTLEAWMNSKSGGEACSVEEAVDIICQLAHALGHIHAAGYLHRDVRPGTVLYSPTLRTAKFFAFGRAVKAGSLTRVASPESEGNSANDNPFEVREPRNVNEDESAFLSMRESQHDANLAWCSPEMSGRTNEDIDYRADLYSLGAVFFYLLAGVPPFADSDPLELMYSHLARAPPLLASLPLYQNENMPLVLDDIIQRLLAKTPSGRYFSAFGLCLDLRHLRKAIDEYGVPNVPRFPVAVKDKLSQFTIPEKMYARDRYLKLLDTSFERCSKGASELVLVSASSGVGKTTTVKEIQRTVTAGSGFFISGKFDQYKRGIPYFAVIQAFRDLIMQNILVQSVEQLEKWRVCILEALGSTGRVMTNLIPELELIIGEQPPIPALSPAEAKNRLNRVLLQFTQVFATAEHPVVLFIDDVQWGSSSAGDFDYLSLLLTNAATHHLMIICAYRDNEVDSTHAFMGMLDTIREAGKSTVVDIKLTLWDAATVAEVIRDTFLVQDPPPEEMNRIQGLVDLVHHISGGNAFSVNAHLKHLHRESLVKFDFDEERWVWDVERIRISAMSWSGGLVGIMAYAIKSLPERGQEVVRVASCIGAVFSVETLTLVLGRPTPEVITNLYTVAKAEVIIPIANQLKIFEGNTGPSSRNRSAANLTTGGTPMSTTSSEGGSSESTPGSPGSESSTSASNSKHFPLGLLSAARLKSMTLQKYRFRHDSVQQAAYSFIPEDQKQRTHLAIARHMLKHANDPNTELLFEIMTHFNKATFLVLEQGLTVKSSNKQPETEAHRCAALNLRTGCGALSAAAYACADEYLTAGCAFLEGEGNYDQDLFVKLRTELALAKYLMGDFQAAQRETQIVLNTSDKILDRIRVHEIEMQFHIQQHQMREALDIGLAALETLKVELCTEPPQLVEVDLTKAMEDPADLYKMRILMNLCAPTYVLDPGLNARTAWTLVDLAYKNGNSKFAAFGYGLFGLFLAGCRRIEEAYIVGQLSLKTAELYAATEFEAKIAGLFYAHVLVWKRHLAEGLPRLLRGHWSGLENGDLEWAGYDAFYYCDSLFFKGTALSQVHQVQNEHYEALVRRNQTLQATYLTIWRRLVIKLKDGVDTAAVSEKQTFNLAGRNITDEELLNELVTNQNHMFAFTAYIAKCMLYYYVGDYTEAVAAAAAGVPHASGCWGMMTNSQHNFYYSLSLLGMLHRLPVDHVDRAALEEKVVANQQILREWATHAPMNYEHKLLLVEAEMMRSRGEILAALKQYEVALALSRDQGFTHETALIWNLAADAAREGGLNEFASMFARHAYNSYGRWESRLKQLELERKWAGVFLSGQATNISGWSSTSEEPATKIDSPLSVSSSAASLPLSALHSHLNAGSASTPTTQSGSTAELDLVTLLKASQIISGEIVVRNILEKLIKLLMEISGATTALMVAYELSSRGFRLLARGGVEQKNVVLDVASNQESVGGDVPTSVFLYVQRTGKQLIVNDVAKDKRFAHETYILKKSPKSMMCMPIVFQNKSQGLVYLENHLFVNAFTVAHARTLSILSSQAAISLANADFYTQLQSNTFAIEERNRELHGMNEALRTALQEREKTEKELVVSKYQKGLAEAEIVSKTLLLANTSHEIRTPMNGILGMLRFLMETDLTADQKEYVDTIRVSANALLNLINDIVDLSKLEAGELELENIEFDLTEMMDDALDILIGQAHSKGLELVCFMDSRIPRVLRGDPKRIRQIIINLANNGLKFTPKGHIIVKTVLVTESPTNTLVRFEIIDSGIGIEEKNLAKLFKPFSQVDASHTRLYGGSGLGLAICKRLIQKMNGTIGVASKLSDGGSGSTFWVQVPFDKALTSEPTFLAPEMVNRCTLVLMPDGLHWEGLQNRFELCGLPYRHVTTTEAALAILDSPNCGGVEALLLDAKVMGVAGVSLQRAVVPSKLSLDSTASILNSETSLDDMPTLPLLQSTGDGVRSGRSSSTIPISATPPVVGSPAVELSEAASFTRARSNSATAAISVSPRVGRTASAIPQQNPALARRTTSTSFSAPGSPAATLPRRFSGQATPVGPDFEKVLSARPYGHHLPVILLVLKSQRSLVTSLVSERGFADVLTVPVKRVRLTACLQRVWDPMWRRPCKASGAGSSSLSRPGKLGDGDAATPKAKKKVIGPWPGAERVRMLLAEDNPINQRVVVPMLRRLGFPVDVVDDGKQAVEAAAGNVYDMILMDCQMPEMSGYVATTTLRQSWAGDGIQRADQAPIIAMTANAMADDRQKCLDCGMDGKCWAQCSVVQFGAYVSGPEDYISKPIDTLHLHTVLDKWMKHVLERKDKEAASDLHSTILEEAAHV
ncbi:hypothetical protein DFS34DRAFT_321472 [Phlyctochytrium arcticum]|nr:hypothetical protein DFS34DRAFT_321472 [Phlyctochytrium arcticum]